MNDTEIIPLDVLIGRVLAEPIIAPVDLPLFDNSAVDGYALRWADTKRAPVELTCIGEIAAGDSVNYEIGAGECVRVFTGSRLPFGGDAIVMLEHTECDGNRVTVKQAVEKEAGIRRQGEEMPKGNPVFPEWSLFDPVIITPSVLGVLSSFGITRAEVFKRPRVSVIGTGSELVPPGNELCPGQIYESNSRSIAAAVELLGCQVQLVKNVKDDVDEIRRTLENALMISDVVITCGGVSVGDHDVVRQCADGLGVKEIFWRIDLRPGKPFYFGKGAQEQLVFGLPGNPVSALVTYLALVRPSLKKMMGVGSVVALSTVLARTTLDIRKAKGRTEILRSVAHRGGNGDLWLEPVGQKGSHIMTALAYSTHMIVLDEDVEFVQEGHVVNAVPIVWELEHCRG